MFFFLLMFFHAFCKIVSCITCFYFLKHTKAFKLGGELAICPMTIGQIQMHETPNLYLSVCLVITSITALAILYNTPILPLQRSSLGRYETRFETQ